MDTIDLLNRIGPFMSGVGLLLTGSAAWVTVFIISRRTLHLSWVNGFRQSYDEFWKDDKIAKVRRWIVNDNDYNDVKTILAERLKQDKNVLDADSNNVLEAIDRFCALIMKTDYFERTMMSKSQRQVFHGAYVRFWMKKIESGDRIELRKYIEKFWPSIEFK